MARCVMARPHQTFVCDVTRLNGCMLWFSVAWQLDLVGLSYATLNQRYTTVQSRRVASYENALCAQAIKHLAFNQEVPGSYPHATSSRQSII